MGRITENREWRCKACAEISLDPHLLTAPSPFDPEDTLVGCPECKACEGFDLICDESGCTKGISSGWPTGNDDDAWGGYRQTCYEHSKRLITNTN